MGLRRTERAPRCPPPTIARPCRQRHDVLRCGRAIAGARLRRTAAARGTWLQGGGGGGRRRRRVARARRCAGPDAEKLGRQGTRTSNLSTHVSHPARSSLPSRPRRCDKRALGQSLPGAAHAPSLRLACARAISELIPRRPPGAGAARRRCGGMRCSSRSLARRRAQEHGHMLHRGAPRRSTVVVKRAEAREDPAAPPPPALGEHVADARPRRRAHARFSLVG